jgi:hypothetical protein
VLRARWLAWTLTSTDRDLRDAATAALYWFGRHDPAGLFAITIEALGVNDPYVPERMVAAAYGVTTAHQLHDQAFETELAKYLSAIIGALAGPDAASPTSHALLRYYVASTFDFASTFYPAAVPAGTTLPLAFMPGPAVPPLPEGDPRRDEVKRALRMDFHNYTLGRLFPDRNNYDYKHSGHQEATDYVLGVAHALGWREDLFSEVEARIDDGGRRTRQGRLERYGKKYGWIGMYTFAGILEDRGRQGVHLEVDIDPTFPPPPPPLPLPLATWARRTPAPDADWLRKGIVKLPDSIVMPTMLESDPGPWLLVHAELEAEDAATGRNVFGLINAVVVDQADVADLVDELGNVDYPGRDLIDVPGAYYVFAGEIPWHERYASPEPDYTVREMYTDIVHRNGRDIHAESLTHHYAWESYHSSENQAAAYIPSKLFSEAFDLRSLPASFDQVEPSGRVAARSFVAPAGFTGELLYLRTDLVRLYASGKSVVLFAWGERRVQFTWPEEAPRAARNAYASHANVWRVLRQY